MYKVLYRKYRPLFFSDVIGQPQVTVTLKNQLKNGRISHAYLFTGSRGTGKTTCAKILARAVNCLSPKDGDPCGECEICRGLEEGSILDVVEIDAASNNGVDSIRSLIEESNFTPATAKYRVYIIDEVHMLSVAAFNALLKTLEEPPQHVIFILATTEVHKLLPTILSRCQRFDFRRVSPEDIAGRLEYVCQQENAKIDHDAALKIARIADGGVRDALSILDQCLGKAEHVTMEIVNETAGVADRAYLMTLVEAVRERNAGTAINVIAELYRGSKDMSRLCEEMAEYFRAMMIVKTTNKPETILAYEEEELGSIVGLAENMKLSEIVHGLDTFEQTLNKMRFANQRTELEMAFVRLASPELDTSSEAILRRLEDIEGGMPAGNVPIRTLPLELPTARPVPEFVKERNEQARETEKPAENIEDEPVVAEVEQSEEAPAEPVEPLVEDTLIPPPTDEPLIIAEEAESVAAAETTETQLEDDNEPELVDDFERDELEKDELDNGEEPEVAQESEELPDEAQEERDEPIEGQITLGGEEVTAGESKNKVEELSREAARFSKWGEVLEALKTQAPRSIVAAFAGSKAYENDGFILIDAPQIGFELLKKADFRMSLKETIKQITGKTYNLGPYTKTKKVVEEDPLDLLVKRIEDFKDE